MSDLPISSTSSQKPEDDPIVLAIRALLGAQALQQTVQDRIQRPGTVVTYDAVTNRATVRVDGDTDPVQMAVLMAAPTAGDRVMVSFEKPRGVFVSHPL